jgi:hypothetical protein
MRANNAMTYDRKRHVMTFLCRDRGAPGPRLGGAGGLGALAAASGAVKLSVAEVATLPPAPCPLESII